MSISIGELAERGVLTFSDGYRTKRAEHGRPGFRILRVADVADGRVSPTGGDFVAEIWEGQIGAKLARAGDVLLTTKGTVGRVAIMPPLDEQVVYSPQLCYFRVLDAGRLDARWLSYWFKSDDFLHQASHRANNTDMAAYINLADIRSLQVPVLAIREQRRIAEVLGALDDRIAANAKLTVTAESLMAARYELAVERDARRPRLEAVAQFHNRRRVPLSAKQREVRVGRVPYYGATGIFDYVDEALFGEHLVLVGEDGSVVQPSGRPVVQYVWGPAWVNNHAHVLTGAGMATETLRLAIQRTNVVPIVTGAVQPKISMGNLKSLTLDVPSPQELVTLEPLVSSLSAVVRAKTEESRHLAEVRDALLPQLMSGTIGVKVAERVVEGGV